MKRLFTAIFVLSLLLSVIIQPLLAQDEEPLYEEIIGATALSAINLRDEASTANPSIGSLAAGTQVIILEEITDGQAVNGNSLWYRVQLEDGSEAFIWSGALSEPEVVSRRCLTILPPDPTALWFLERDTRGSSLMKYNPENNTLRAGGNAGNSDILWTTSVTG